MSIRGSMLTTDNGVCLLRVKECNSKYKASYLYRRYKVLVARTSKFVRNERTKREKQRLTQAVLTAPHAAANRHLKPKGNQSFLFLLFLPFVVLAANEIAYILCVVLRARSDNSACRVVAVVVLYMNIVFLQRKAGFWDLEDWSFHTVICPRRVGLRGPEEWIVCPPQLGLFVAPAPQRVKPIVRKEPCITVGCDSSVHARHSMGCRVRLPFREASAFGMLPLSDKRANE
jgi:hypothetical protein